MGNHSLSRPQLLQRPSHQTLWTIVDEIRTEIRRDKRLERKWNRSRAGPVSGDAPEVPARVITDTVEDHHSQHIAGLLLNELVDNRRERATRCDSIVQKY